MLATNEKILRDLFGLRIRSLRSDLCDDDDERVFRLAGDRLEPRPEFGFVDRFDADDDGEDEALAEERGRDAARVVVLGVVEIPQVVFQSRTCFMFDLKIENMFRLQLSIFKKINGILLVEY